ncbi:NosD domain-containing protein [Natrinema sp. 1APR25-10V2]|uniref:NosD domain-containing protein n=1 Tax=Natrinema sp. 1APR25-10V2 TaxID=2951081 RepID=UPI002875BF72|nr:NosD domain-containing protein [Natrinema sp. 1APR25-10V2]MDS0478382.1 right-handed parallel beta-helix repeat-containing protein [Natrinema sp. 1APR25-10V2]
MIDRSASTVFLSFLLVTSLCAAGLFAVDVGSTSPEPVAFNNTVSVGLTLESEYSLDDAVKLPRAQVFYSQYQYVVGYYGVETFVENQRQPAHDQRFGYPLTVYVTNYSDTEVELTDEGYPVTDGSPGWTDAETAWFVVGSEARTPAGETVIPFADRDDARAFTDEHGGSVQPWEAVLERSFDRDDAAVARDRVDDHRQLADERVENATALTERPTSLVVGENRDTVQAAIDRAPANTTVVLPEGTYAEKIEIDRPITLAGEGNVTLRGDGNGSVITVTSDRVAVRGIDITGVGNVTREGGDIPVEIDEQAWDATFTKYYAGTDAGIAAYDARGLLVQNVSIETPASGIIAYQSEDAVAQNVTVSGPGPAAGLAGILLFQSPSVVENSTFHGGRNGIYLYRSPRTIVRSNTIENNFLGVHLMYTGDTLLADNELREQPNHAIMIMTGPERNAVVGNTVRNAEAGISTGGSGTYVAYNLLANNDLGLRVDSTTSIYEHNVIVGNDVGAEASALLPTNRVVDNDFVGNDIHATAMSGPLRVWSRDGRGNYWQGAAGVANGGQSDLSYSPTDPIDRRLHRTDGTPTLARAPALKALAGLEGTVPGMRTGSIVDRAPSCAPNNPDVLERTEWKDDAWTCYETTQTSND